MIGGLKDQAVSAIAAIIHEPVAAHDHVFRKHDRCACSILSKRVVLKNVSVRIHVVQTVTDVMDDIVFDMRVVGKRKINAIARVADLIAADQISFTIPLMNSVAAAIGDKSGVTILGALADSFFY